MVNPLLHMQLRRAGAMAMTKAIADKAQFEFLNLDANEISEAAVDDIKVNLPSRNPKLIPTCCAHCCVISLL